MKIIQRNNYFFLPFIYCPTTNNITPGIIQGYDLSLTISGSPINEYAMNIMIPIAIKGIPNLVKKSPIKLIIFHKEILQSN